MMMGIGLLLMLLFWGALIIGVFWLVKTVIFSSRQKISENISLEHLSPREILDKRYARGEISREEYEQIKADLV